MDIASAIIFFLATALITESIVDLSDITADAPLSQNMKKKITKKMGYLTAITQTNMKTKKLTKIILQKPVKANESRD